MFEHTQKPNRAVLIHLQFSAPEACEDVNEFQALVHSAGCDIADLIVGARQMPDKRLFVGSGKADEIKQSVTLHQADLVIFNHALSPSQVRNLENHLKVRVIDRTSLILDIFATRARTYEGKLQVELAQLVYLSTRLVRGWTHLERQKGGIGLRGPGETQLETDRRLIRHRIKALKKRLEKVRKTRGQSRAGRQKANVLTLALVGYTNAGKSTLFNALTESDVFVQDQLFATLDPTLRQIQLAGLGQVLLADTVGFIRHLPHDLVDAFRATLEEVREADLLLHVVDASDALRQNKIEEVNGVLKQIGAEDQPVLMVYNKIDALPEAQSRMDCDETGLPYRVWLSAKAAHGFVELRQALNQRLTEEYVEATLTLMPREATIRHQLYEAQVVLQETVDDVGNCILKVKAPKRLLKLYDAVCCRQIIVSA